jgi:hypothetical protein
VSDTTGNKGIPASFIRKINNQQTLSLNRDLLIIFQSPALKYEWTDSLGKLLTCNKQNKAKMGIKRTWKKL